MVTLLKTVENLPHLTPAELSDRHKRRKTPGNKAAFLRAACGTLSAAEADRMRKLIDESCERIEE